jgi:hypothetical protein
MARLSFAHQQDLTNGPFFDADQRIISQQSIHLMLRASSEGLTEEFMGKLVLGVVALALSAGAASAQVYVSPGYGYGSGYGYGNGFGAPAYGYATTAPLYDYAAPAYGYAAPALAPAQAGTTIVIVTPAPAYTAPTVGYAPGYWGGYGWGGGYGRAGWWR